MKNLYTTLLLGYILMKIQIMKIVQI